MAKTTTRTAPDTIAEFQAGENPPAPHMDHEVSIEVAGSVFTKRYFRGLQEAIEELGERDGILINDAYRRTIFFPRHMIRALTMEGIL